MVSLGFRILSPRQRTEQREPYIKRDHASAASLSLSSCSLRSFRLSSAPRDAWRSHHSSGPPAAAGRRADSSSSCTPSSVSFAPLARTQLVFVRVVLSRRLVSSRFSHPVRPMRAGQFVCFVFIHYRRIVLSQTESRPPDQRLLITVEKPNHDRAVSRAHLVLIAACVRCKIAGPLLSFGALVRHGRQPKISTTRFARF